MSIEKITGRILQEAKDEAAVLTNAAREEAEARLAEAKAQAEALTKEMAAKAAQDAATLKERKSSVAELEARKLVLGAKQEMIEKSFAEAVKELADMPADKYLEFILDQLKGYTEGEVLLSAKDQKKLGEALAKKLSGTGLTVSKETADIAGGFILKKGNISANGSLESILDTVKKQITAQIADVLFS